MMNRQPQLFFSFSRLSNQFCFTRTVVRCCSTIVACSHSTSLLRLNIVFLTFLLIYFRMRIEPMQSPPVVAVGNSRYAQLATPVIAASFHSLAGVLDLQARAALATATALQPRFWQQTKASSEPALAASVLVRRARTPPQQLRSFFLISRFFACASRRSQGRASHECAQAGPVECHRPLPPQQHARVTKQPLRCPCHAGSGPRGSAQRHPATGGVGGSCG